MEIGDEGVNDLKPVGRMDEQVRLALPGRERTDLRDRHDAAATALTFPDRSHSRLGQAGPFGVHPMLRVIRHVDRSEGAQAHMERHERRADAAFVESLEYGRREVQPRRWCRDGPRLASIDGLVVL